MNEKYQRLKENYLSIACKSIHKDKRLYKRIYKELSEHMDDMYDDFAINNIDETSIPEMIIAEMGNAEELGKELYNANKKKYWTSLTITILLRTIIFFVLLTYAPPMLNEAVDYMRYWDVETIEDTLTQEYGEITFLGEYESNNKTYRLYIPVVQPKDCYEVYSAMSGTIWGKNLPDKFRSYYRDYHNSPMIQCSFIRSDDCFPCGGADAIIFLAPTNAKYISFTYKPCSTCNPDVSEEETITSEVFEIADVPCVIPIEYIQGYSMYKFNYFDENLNPIKEPFDEQYKKNGFPTSGCDMHTIM